MWVALQFNTFKCASALCKMSSLFYGEVIKILNMIEKLILFMSLCKIRIVISFRTVNLSATDHKNLWNHVSLTKIESSGTRNEALMNFTHNIWEKLWAINFTTYFTKQIELLIMRNKNHWCFEHMLDFVNEIWQLIWKGKNFEIHVHQVVLVCSKSKSFSTNHR